MFASGQRVMIKTHARSSSRVVSFQPGCANWTRSSGKNKFDRPVECASRPRLGPPGVESPHGPPFCGHRSASRSHFPCCPWSYQSCGSPTMIDVRARLHTSSISIPGGGQVLKRVSAGVGGSCCMWRRCSASFRRWIGINLALALNMSNSGFPKCSLSLCPSVPLSLSLPLLLRALSLSLSPLNLSGSDQEVPRQRPFS